MEKKKILIIRLSSIGDIVLTTPVIKAIKRKYSCSIDFLVMSNFKEAIDCNPLIDNYILFDKSKYKGMIGIFKFCRENLNEYDIILDLHSKYRSKIVSKLTRAREKLRYKKRDLITTILVRMGMIPYKSKETIVKSYFSVFNKSKLLKEVSYENDDLDFYYNKDDESNLLDKLKLEDNYIVVGPGASKKTKQWPIEYWNILVDELINIYDTKVYIIGSNKEKENHSFIRGYNNQVEKGNIINISGQLSLNETGVLMKNANFLILNDSGPFHIARALKSKIYVIFGPTDPSQFTLNNNVSLIYNNQKCSACSFYGNEKCPKEHFRCMLDLKPDLLKEMIIKGEVVNE